MEISCVGKIRNAYKTFIGKSRGLPRLKCVDNKGIYAGRAQCENVVDYVSPAKNSNQWTDVVKAKFKFPVPQRRTAF